MTLATHIKRRSAAVVLALACPGPAMADDAPKLEPFASDGCSEFPDGTLRQQTLWLDCCTAHDRAYWLGGTYAEREAADDALEQCVAKVGEPEIGLVMLAGVRMGGSPFWPTRFRWGYGWPYFDGWLPRGYKVLTAAERELAARLSQSAAAATDND